MTRVIIDTDAGVDDAVAVLMTLHGFPRDAVVGITTVFGNVDLHQANHNVAQYVCRSVCLSVWSPQEYAALTHTN
ncbi:hypothetical protein PINS_up015360 [Pythium insidiosum]|nr:hypothetical protein PINS_up015360 [Pythium insidiosum]